MSNQDVTEKQFWKTMVEVIKYEDYHNRDELLTILRNSTLTFRKTTKFTKKSWQSWEYIDLRVPIPMMNAARELKQDLETLARNIYLETTDYDFAGLEIKPKIIDYDFNENIEHDVIFDEIKDTIIQGIRGAKYTIWVAVAWFTDREIYEELLLRKNAGVNVRVIVSEEESNKSLFRDLRQNFDSKTIPKWGWYSRNRLHDKFCIIDLEYVMHGSYNWSFNAQNSEETWATALDRDFVKKFADEFVRLYNKNNV